jgi:predicted RNase H-like HicB family nuclease
MRYAVIIEQTESNFSAYVQDLAGCVAAAATLEDVEREIREAIRFHLDGLREDGIAIPSPTSMAEYAEA